MNELPVLVLTLVYRLVITTVLFSADMQNPFLSPATTRYKNKKLVFLVKKLMQVGDLYAQFSGVI